MNQTKALRTLIIVALIAMVVNLLVITTQSISVSDVVIHSCTENPSVCRIGPPLTPYVLKPDLHL